MAQKLLKKCWWNWPEELTKIEEHGDEDDDPEPDVELDREVNYGNDDVDEGGNDGEDDVVEKSVDRGRAAIHDPQNFAGLLKLNIGSCMENYIWL